MFLAHRAAQAEYFDAPERTAAELREHYAWLGRINRLTQFDRPFRQWLPDLVGAAACPRLTLLDLGAGDGSLGRTLRTWAGTCGWDWQFTGVDLCPHTVGLSAELNPGVPHVLGSVTALPFPDASFDIAIATTMTHHLDTDADVVAHFREAARVARLGILICDMRRNPLFLAALTPLLWGLRAPREFRRDGLLSVRRGWRVDEWRPLAAAAGLVGARVWGEHGTRVLLSWRRSPPGG